MTNSQAILAEARELAQDESVSVERRIEALENIGDEIRNLIDDLRSNEDELLPV